MPNSGPDTMPTSRPIALVALLSWLLVATSAGAQGDGAASAAERMGLVGPVSAMSEYQTYEPETEEPRLRQEWTFSPAGEVASRVSYSYNFSDGSLRYRRVTSYDADGRRTGAENVAPDGTIVGTTTYAYDGAGREVEEVAFDETGAETLRFVQEYDGAGNLIAREIYRNGELADRNEYDYDGQGRRVGARGFDGDGTLEEETTYTVPDLEYEVVRYDEGEVESRSVVVRGEHGVVSAETYLPDGTLESGTYFAYDEAGRTVQREDVVTYESLGEVRTSSSVTVYEYEFDEQGNWVRRTSIEDTGVGPTPIELQVREIAYD